jgi:tetratricopeptide (TPR) repeat protein
MGRADEAVAVYDQALAACGEEALAGGPEGLSHVAADALVNKGNALLNLERPAEAASCYEKAVTVYRRLAGDKAPRESFGLACALSNWGAALNAQGLCAEAVACYDESLQVYRTFGLGEGWSELTANVIAALVNRANVLHQLQRPDEARDSYDEAINLGERVTQADARCTDQLARALRSKGIFLARESRWEQAIPLYEDAAGRLANRVREGTVRLLPDLVRTVRYLVMALVRLRRLAEAAAALARVLAQTNAAIGDESLPGAVLPELGGILAQLRQLAPQEREEVLAGLGDWRQDVERWLSRVAGIDP